QRRCVVALLEARNQFSNIMRRGPESEPAAAIAWRGQVQGIGEPFLEWGAKDLVPQGTSHEAHVQTVVDNGVIADGPDGVLTATQFRPKGGEHAHWLAPMTWSGSNDGGPFLTKVTRL